MTNDRQTKNAAPGGTGAADGSAGDIELPSVNQDEEVLEINRHGQLVRKGTANPLGARCRDESGEY